MHSTRIPSSPHAMETGIAQDTDPEPVNHIDLQPRMDDRIAAETPDWPRLFQLPRTSRWRVKLCRLDNESWQAHGFGELWCERNEATRETWMLIQDESPSHDIILRCRIRVPLSFRKQETLLFCAGPERNLLTVGSQGKAEPEPLSDRPIRLAIGFQDATGCAIISDFLVFALSHWATGVTFTVQASDEGSDEGETELLIKPLQLPSSPTRENAADSVQIISQLLKITLGREFLAIYVEQTEYLSALHELFLKTEHEAGSNLGDKELLRSCIRTFWALSDIVKQLVLLSDALVIDSMVGTEQFSRIIGILEYDRSFGGRRANFRYYYRNHTAMQRVTAIKDRPVLERIQRTFRLQMLKDILIRSADEYPFRVLGTMIYLNQVEILDSLQRSARFCEDLFGVFDETAEELNCETITTEKNNLREQAVRFINEALKVSGSFPQQQAQALYEVLMDYGLFEALKYALAPQRSTEIKTIGLESLAVILGYDTDLMSLNMDATIERLTALICEPNASDDGTGTVRAMQIQAADMIKNLMEDKPVLTSHGFFELASKYLDRGDLALSSVSIQLILEIVSFAFVRVPRYTSEMVVRNQIWTTLVSRKLTKKESRGLYDTEIILSLIDAVRGALQPVTGEARVPLIAQVDHLVSSGLIDQLMAMFIDLGNSNTMLHSSCLSLLSTISSSFAKGEPQLLTVVRCVTKFNMGPATDLVPGLHQIVAVMNDETLDESGVPSLEPGDDHDENENRDEDRNEDMEHSHSEFHDEVQAEARLDSDDTRVVFENGKNDHHFDHTAGLKDALTGYGASTFSRSSLGARDRPSTRKRRTSTGALQTTDSPVRKSQRSDEASHLAQGTAAAVSDHSSPLHEDGNSQNSNN